LTWLDNKSLNDPSAMAKKLCENQSQITRSKYGERGKTKYENHSNEGGAHKCTDCGTE